MIISKPIINTNTKLVTEEINVKKGKKSWIKNIPLSL